MNDFLERLKQRKLVQWAIAYVAAAFALLQGIDSASAATVAMIQDLPMVPVPQVRAGRSAAVRRSSTF